MRKIAVVVGLLSVIGWHGQASAQFPVTVTQVTDTPAATLLLPYFEVALPKALTGKAKGLNTLFSINNASATAVLSHVTIWSELAIPVLAFNIYLTGYDMQTVDLGALFTGTLPATASAGQDPGDKITPHGQFSQDINFASCTGQLPFTQMPDDYIAHVQAALTGKPSEFFSGDCASFDHGDRVARGFVTVDTVNNCTLRFPGDAGYFGAGGTGDATNQNVLWGDYYYIDGAKKVGFGDALVHIVASATNAQTSVAGQYTFYGRLVNWTAADNREPLSTSFAARYINTPQGPLFPGGSSLFVWRDPKVKQGPFACGGAPAWVPLAQQGIVAFDEQEHTEDPAAPNPFPVSAQRVKIDGPDLPVSFDSGWLYLNLNTTVAAAGSNPPEDAAATQAWVTVVHENKGRFTVGNRAVQLDSATTASHFAP